MNIAVLTLTRDRLAYTTHCFQTLRDHAGCEYDHYVLDQGSADGTREWLLANLPESWIVLLPGNIGICAGLNQLLERVLSPVTGKTYDVIVRFDNDCEVVQPGTLKAVCEAAAAGDAIVAPRVLGLRHPPATGATFPAGGYTVGETAILGGVFMAIPGRLFDAGFRYDEASPLWSGDERICDWYRARGGRCGYLDGYAVNHYLTTDGQAADIPAYFAQKRLEGCPC